MGTVGDHFVCLPTSNYYVVHKQHEPSMIHEHIKKKKNSRSILLGYMGRHFSPILFVPQVIPMKCSALMT